MTALFSLTAVQWASLIIIPVLIFLLVVLLIILLSKRNKTDTLAGLAYSLNSLKTECEKGAKDLKSLKKLETLAARCSLLCDTAVGTQQQDIGSVPEYVARARKILRALCDVKASEKKCARFMPLVINELSKAHSFLISTLGIHAAPAYASLKFFSKNMKSDEAKRYLDSLLPPEDDE